MKWMRERDLLIAQTMAFVQSVTGKKPDADKTVETSVTMFSIETSSVETSEHATTTSMPDIEALLAEALAADLPREMPQEMPREVSREAMPPALRPAPVTRAEVRSDFQSEIKARVANFRANQARFSQEREAYCSATMAKVHASLREMPSPRAGK